MVNTRHLLPYITLGTLLGTGHAFLIDPTTTRLQRTSTMGLRMAGAANDDEAVRTQQSRRHALTKAASAAVSMLVVAGGVPLESCADVADGNVLPQGAQQFARVVKLKTDLKDVKKRVDTAGAGEIEKKEWDNISKFLRNVYSTAENDMKGVAKGVYNPDNQKRAVKDLEQIKKYAQAGDVSVSKQDTSGLSAVLAKAIELTDDFLDSLSDVPDEI